MGSDAGVRGRELPVVEGVDAPAEAGWYINPDIASTGEWELDVRACPCGCGGRSLVMIWGRR